jgi:hypothetical protein
MASVTEKQQLMDIKPKSCLLEGLQAVKTLVPALWMVLNVFLLLQAV